MNRIVSITPDNFDLEALSALLIDAVASGASIGFIAPLAKAEADAYWREVCRSLNPNTFILLGYYEQGELVGSVQLDCSTKDNGRHRAEVQKLFVLQSHRGKGIGAALMAAIEAKAKELNRWLLFLDTRLGDDAERLYTRVGYTRVGVIPDFAANSSGGYSATVFFYKHLNN